MEDKGEIPPTEENEWAEWNWMQSKRKEKDPCDDRTDCVWECVQGSPIPTEYKKSKDMQIGTGTCGFKFQVTNANEQAPFTVTILRNNALATTMTGLAAAAVTLTMF